MSYRSERFLRYHGESVPSLPYPIDDRSPVELRDLFLEILHNKVHGFCFSMYEEGQQPGDLIPEAQVRRRLQLLQRHAHWIRSFSCIEGNENVPKVARELGMNTLVGAWLGKDKEKNRQEIKALIDLARQGYVDIAAVGNEVLYRKDLSEDELLQYIDTVKQAIPEVQVGYVDAYYEFVQRPSIAAACDVILTNCYPFWEGTSFETSLDHMKQMYGQAREKQAGQVGAQASALPCLQPGMPCSISSIPSYGPWTRISRFSISPPSTSPGKRVPKVKSGPFGEYGISTEI